MGHRLLHCTCTRRSFDYIPRIVKADLLALDMTHIRKMCSASGLVKVTLFLTDTLLLTDTGLASVKGSYRVNAVVAGQGCRASLHSLSLSLAPNGVSSGVERGGVQLTPQILKERLVINILCEAFFTPDELLTPWEQGDGSSMMLRVSH